MFGTAKATASRQTGKQISMSNGIGKNAEEN